MENTKTIYEQNQQKSKQTNNQTKKRDFKKQDLILKDKLLNISLKNNYIDINNGVLSQIYGIHTIKKLYIHKDIHLSISDCFTISKYIKIYFIDANGNIIAKYKRSKTI